MGQTCGTNGKERNVHRVLVRKSEGMRLLERFRNRWKDHIKMYPKEVGLESVDWINLPQDRHNWQAYAKELMTFGSSWTFKSLVWCKDIL